MSTVFGKGFLRAAWRSAPEKSAQGKFDCAAGARERRDFVRRRFEQPHGVREGTDGYVDDAPVFGFRQNSPRELYDVGEFPAARVFEKGIFGGSCPNFSPRRLSRRTPRPGGPSAIYPTGTLPFPKYSFSSAQKTGASGVPLLTRTAAISAFP